MFEYSCKKAGGCGYSVTAEDEQELKVKVTEHARTKHNVAEMNDTIYNYMRDSAR